MTLLAASSRLVRAAKRWYEMQSGSVLESWAGLKQGMRKLFIKKILFYAAMQRIEARK